MSDENFLGSKVTLEQPINNKNIGLAGGAGAYASNSLGVVVDPCTYAHNVLPRILIADAVPVTSEYADAPTGSIMLVIGAVPYYKHATSGWLALA